MSLLPWQQFTLTAMLARRLDGLWSSREFGLVAGRQNGKGEVLMTREFAALFLLGDRKVVHSAHEFTTSLDHFRRMRDVLEASDVLMRRMPTASQSRSRGIRQGSGKEAFELASGARLDFKARHGGGSGRGLSGDLSVVDEAMYFSEALHGSLMPIISARRNPQIVYGLSAPDQRVHPDAHVVARARRRALSKEDPLLGWLEWSAPVTVEEALTRLDDEALWIAANPSYPALISREAIEAERRSMRAREFMTERLGVGDWPEPVGEEEAAWIAALAWAALADDTGDTVRRHDERALALDCTWGHTHAAFAAAARRDDGALVEVLGHRAGTHWVVETAAKLTQDVGVPLRVAKSSPAAALIADLRRARVDVVEVAPAEEARACSEMHRAALEPNALAHVQHPALDVAVAGAVLAGSGDEQRWSRRKSNVDISPLVSVTLARHALGITTTAPFFEVIE